MTRAAWLWTLQFILLLLLFAKANAATPSSTGTTGELTASTVKVNKVSVVQREGSLDIEIAGSGPLTAKTMKLLSPARVVVDITNALVSRNQTIGVDSGNIKAIRVGQFQSVPPTTRVVVDLQSPEPFELTSSGDKVILTLPVPVTSTTPSAAKQQSARPRSARTSQKVESAPVIPAKADSNTPAANPLPVVNAVDTQEATQGSEVAVAPTQVNVAGAAVAAPEAIVVEPESSATLTTGDGSQASAATTLSAKVVTATQTTAATATTTTTPSLTLTASGSLILTPGASGNVLIKASATGGLSSAVTLSSTAAWYPGVTTSFSKASFAAPGNGSTILTVNTLTSTPVGTLYVSVYATAGSKTYQITVKVTVRKTSTLLVRSGSTVTLGKGQSSSVAIATSAMDGFNSAVSLTVASSYSGVSGKVSPASIAAPGGGGSTLTVTASSTATVGTYFVSVTASGGSQTAKTYIAVTIANPTLTLSASSSPSVKSGASATTAISTTPAYGFNSTVALSAKTTATGVTVGLSPTSIAAPGKGTSTLSVKASTTAPVGSYTATVTATGGGLTKALTVKFTVTSGSSSTSGHVVEVSFSASATSNVTYNLYRCSTSATACAYTSNFSRINVSPVTVSPYSDSGVASGVTYYYAVTAVDGKGLESPKSNIGKAAVP